MNCPKCNLENINPFVDTEEFECYFCGYTCPLHIDESDAGEQNEI